MFGVQPDINHTSSRRDTECCKLRGRPRAIPPGSQADRCQTYVAWLSSRARSRHVPMKAPQKPIANHPYWDRNAKKLQRVVDIGCA